MKRVVITIGIGLMPPPSALIGPPISGARTIQPIISPLGLVAGAAISSDCVQNPTRDRGNPNGDPIGEHSCSSHALAGPSGLTAAASTAATLTNLLPFSNLKGGNAVEGVYVGDSHPPVPAKLVKKFGTGSSWTWVSYFPNSRKARTRRQRNGHGCLKNHNR